MKEIEKEREREREREMNEGKLTKRIFREEVDRVRRKGRPKRRWT